MDLVPFEPENDLERVIAEAKRGTRSIEEVLGRVTQTDLFVSSKKEVAQNGSGFEPLLLGDRGEPLIAAFTSSSRPALHRHVAEYVLQMPGRQFFLRMPPGYGVILNPGYSAQLIVLPEVAETLGRQLKAARA